MDIELNGNIYKVEEQRVNEHLTDFFISVNGKYREWFSLHDDNLKLKQGFIDNVIIDIAYNIKQGFIRLQ